MLYWCEGDKATSASSFKIGVTSTDSRMLKLFRDWLIKYYPIKKTDLALRLHLWETIDEDSAKLYWSKELDIPLSQFTKTFVKQKGSRKKVHKYGLCRVSVTRKSVLEKILKDINNEF